MSIIKELFATLASFVPFLIVAFGLIFFSVLGGYYEASKKKMDKDNDD